MQRPSRSLCLAAVLAVSSLACAALAAPPPVTATAAPASQSGGPVQGSVIVRSASGAKSFAVTQRGGTLEIVLPGGARLVGELSGEKRKYRRVSNGQQAG